MQPGTVDRDAGRGTFRQTLALPGVAEALVLLFALVAYGNEIFNLHLTIDEEIFANVEAWRDWLSQGRWGMALLSRFVLPHPVTPVVSSSIGVLGFGAGLVLFVRTLSASRLTLVAAVAFGIVSPALAYLLSFSTISFGVGAAALASAAAFHLLLRQGSWLGAVALFTLAVAVYQSFLVVLPAMLTVYLVAAVMRGEPLPGLWQLTWRTAACTIASGVGYAVGNRLALTLTNTQQTPYVQGKVDLAGLVNHPVVRMRRGASAVRSALSDSPTEFHIHTEHVGALVLILLISALSACAATRDARRFAVAGGALVALGLLLVGLEAATATGADPRTLVHLPFVAAGVAALGLEGLQRLPRARSTTLVAATALGVLTTGLAGDLNSLFFSTKLVYDRDAHLALQVDDRLSELGQPDRNVPLTLVLVGATQPVEGPLTPTRDTIGASFFAWDGGNPQRAAALMSIVAGRAMTPAAAGAAAQAAADSATTPSWPAPGSLRVVGGSVAVLKLSEPTPAQRALWCGTGVPGFCAGPR